MVFHEAHSAGDVEALVRQARSGNAEAWQKLWDMHASMIRHWICLSGSLASNIDDIGQESFIKAFLSINQLKHDAKFVGWLRTIVINHCRSVLRREKIRVCKALPDSDYAEELADYSANPEKKAIKEELKLAVQKKIAELRPIYREVIILNKYEGYSYKEIAGQLNVPIETVRRRLFYALRMLLGELAEAA
jgi:RNA polymerase sigma-70 factor (ECF subfamily)